MKKLYILGLSLMGLATATAQTYEIKDFEDQSITSGGWTTQVPVDTTNWYAASYGGNNFAMISNGINNAPAEAWLISPAIDLSTATSPMVSFETIMKYAGPAIQLMVSTNYDGTSMPSTATWVDITAGATLDVNDQTWGNWTPSGEVDLTPYISSAVYIAFKYTGTTTSGSAWEVDNILVAETGTSGGGNGPSAPTPKTITEIQSDVDGSGESNLKNDSVITAGVVTAVNIYQGNQKGYYIQDGVGAWTGIYVFDTVNTVQRGDSVTITAVVDEYYGATQLKSVTNFAIVSNYNDVPSTLVSTNDAGTEMYESVLIKVVNATCNTLPSGATFGDWIVNDGSGDINIDKRLFQYAPSLGASYDITGIVGYTYSTWEMYPRDGNDIALHTSIKENNAVLTNVYPNPTTGIVTVEVKEATDLVISNLLGSVVYSTQLNNTTNRIDLSYLATGNYILRVGTSVQQLVVK